MSDRTRREDLLVVQALVEFGHRHLDRQPTRARRAWVLAAELAASHGLEPQAALRGESDFEQ